MDQVANFATGQLLNGITAAATSAVLASGQGARFPDPADGAYNIVIWDNTYNSASEAYHASSAEIVRVTAISSDTLTITRAQEGTTARALNVSGHSYNVELNLTALTITNIEGVIPVKVWKGAVSQVGSSIPTASVGVNTLGGTVAWTRTASGEYVGTLAGAFTAGLTFVKPSGRDTASNQPLVMDGYRLTDDTIQIRTFEQDDWTASITIEVFS